MTIHQETDVIIIGSGMGGMSAATLFAHSGLNVTILEAAHLPGGCSSSYKRKGYWFESGATTLIGFNENQPLWYLEKETGVRIPRQEIAPSMTVHLDGKRILRHQSIDGWKQEAVAAFGNKRGQERFWDLAKSVSDVVWKVSLKNPFFPPQNLSDWVRLGTSNNPADVWVLPYAFKSVRDVMRQYGVDSPGFVRFVDEQLMITAQATSEEVPFLFGAAGLTYTNYSNYYVPGGLLNMIRTLQAYIEERGGSLKTKSPVVHIQKEGAAFTVSTKKGEYYKAPLVISNVPVWNMADIVGSSEMSTYFSKESETYDKAWGALTLGLVTDDVYPHDASIHHQIHLDKPIPHTASESCFVSMSNPGDVSRAEAGLRTLNVSCHASPEYWFSLNGNYDQAKAESEQFIIEQLRKHLPGFADAQLKVSHTATPVTWQKWVYRKKGRVGGIPQSMARSLLKWTPHSTPFRGLYLVGDTTYPGQGIPGVTLSGINVYWRVRQHFKSLFS